VTEALQAEDQAGSDAGPAADSHSAAHDVPAAGSLPAAGPPPPSWRRRLQFWRSPAEQPAWARPALLIVAALAGLAYAWGINTAYLEPFYGAAARSMAMSWHNFFFGAFDPWGTVTVDKLPGALWLQSLSLRIFGFHVWAIALPQVIEGVVTVLVLSRAVRRVAGAGAGLLAAVLMAGSPIVILLDRGNISDSLLIMLLVLAVDATTRAYTTGKVASLVWAGVLVGLAFQAKMLQAWLVLPALYGAYLLAAPAVSFVRRAAHVALSAAVTVVVSVSWMTVVSLVPSASRPYVDGSCNDSVFSQVFSYNGLGRINISALGSHAGCHRPSKWIVNLGHYSAAHGLNTGGLQPAWDRLLHGPFGHDGVWLLLPALVSAVALLVLRRHEPRTDVLRATVVLWLTWLVIDFGLFSAGRIINSYYLAALVPPVAALCAFGAQLVWQRRRSAVVRAVLAVTMVATVAAAIVLIPGYVGVRVWIVASLVVVAVLAAGILFASLRPPHASVWSLSVGPACAMLAMLMGSAWASGLVVMEELGPFDAPYTTAAHNQSVRQYANELPQLAHVYAQATLRRPNGALDVIETSYLASEYVLASGHEFLALGGYTGEVPVPTLHQFMQYVAEGKVKLVDAATRPLSRDPSLRWVVTHCKKSDSYKDPYAQTTFTYFTCSPADAAGG
jgi:4-amino-4-deoxy-L-arabinose transferase-like glycosyltransferase